jgi:hypothetical protein
MIRESSFACKLVINFTGFNLIINAKNVLNLFTCQII